MTYLQLHFKFYYTAKLMTSSSLVYFMTMQFFRVLLAKERNPKRWEEEINLMESHDDIRKQKPIWDFNQHNIVEYLRGPCKLDRFSEDLIHKVCGILEINAFEARTPSRYSAIRCLFPKLAILSHNCISNIHHAIDGKGTGDSNDYR